MGRRLGHRRSLANDEIGEAQDQTANTSLAGSDTPTEAPIAHWSDWRIDLMERLWGTGFLLPGGADFVSELTRPLNLGSKTSVLVLGAGMGGPSNSIAKEFGAFIDGIEPDPELAVAGTKRATIVKGMSRVTIKNLSIDDDSAFARKYDAIFGQEILLQRANVSQLLDRCANALKENGKLVITDFTSADETAGSSIEAWLKREKAAGPTREEGELRALFTEAGFRMRTVEDLTDRYIGLVHNGWVALERSLRANAANRDILLGMIEEAERWTQRVMLLKSDQIGYTRLFATKKTKF